MLKTTERLAEMIKPREPPSWIPRIRANLEVRDRPRARSSISNWPLDKAGAGNQAMDQRRAIKVLLRT